MFILNIYLSRFLFVFVYKLADFQRIIPDTCNLSLLPAPYYINTWVLSWLHINFKFSCISSPMKITLSSTLQITENLIKRLHLLLNRSSNKFRKIEKNRLEMLDLFPDLSYPRFCCSASFLFVYCFFLFLRQNLAS